MAFTSIDTAENQTSNRQRTDRRQRHARSAIVSLYRNRRQTVRRSADQKLPVIVDVHETRLLVVVLATVVFCVADAYLTLLILNTGGEELNPFMRELIEHDVHVFFVTKYLMTVLALLFIIVHKHFIFFRRISGYQILYGIFVAYAALISYELYLLA